MTTDPEYRFMLTSNTPILFHNNDIEAKDRLNEWINNPDNQKISKKGDDRTPPWTWQIYLHHDGEHIAVPQDVIMKMLGSAGAKIPTGKGTATFKGLSQSGIVPEKEFFRFTTGGHQIRMTDLYAIQDEPFSIQAERVKGLGFKLFVKPAAVGAVRHIRVRPRFELWQVEGTVTVTDPMITPAILEKLFEIGGKYCGLLDWRPNEKKSPGPYGTFTTELTPIVQQKQRRSA